MNKFKQLHGLVPGKSMAFYAAVLFKFSPPPIAAHHTAPA